MVIWKKCPYSSINKSASETSFLQSSCTECNCNLNLLVGRGVFLFHFPRLDPIPPCQLLANLFGMDDSKQYKDLTLRDVSERDYRKEVSYEIGRFHPNCLKKNAVALSSDYLNLKMNSHFIELATIQNNWMFC